MGDSFFKKENAKKKAKKKQDKMVKKEERKTNNNKGKTFENMFAYVDENGTPNPVLANDESPISENKIKKINLFNNETKTGIVTFLSQLGYGFVTEDETRLNIFFHNKDVVQTVKLKDKVSFEKKKTPRGDNAVNLKNINN